MPVDPDTQCHRLAALMSPWLYSEGKPPSHLNRVWIKWIDTRQAPTRAEIDQAVRADREQPNCQHCGICHTSEETCIEARSRIGVSACK